MKDSAGKIIYIGKAKNIQNRVRSYFASKQQPYSRWKTSLLVSKIHDIEYVITDNELEAFLLESNLIKQYRPVFNIELKDQQRYTYLKITDEIFPRLLVARRNRDGKFTGPKGQVYGPFVRGSSKYLTAGLLRKLFKVRICDRLPDKPCLEYFIKNCDAPCINNVNAEKYMININNLKRILDGRENIEEFIEELKKEMRGLSQSKQYEKAKEIRDTVYRLENLTIKQKMESYRDKSDEEFVGTINDNTKGISHVMMLRRINGVISDRKRFSFDIIGDNTLSNFLLQYYSSNACPKKIYVNILPESKELVENALGKLSGHSVDIEVVTNRRTEKFQIMDLLLRNIKIYINKGYEPALIELKDILSLNSVPVTIDCFDISNHAQSYAVGASTRFVNGKPYKNGYRRFKIKGISRQNDFAMINEIVSRRYQYSESEEERKDPLPDLIVIDGGRGQLNFAIKALSEIGLQIPCIALAKENEEIFTAGSDFPIKIEKNKPSLQILRHIRDEAHRFGLKYNRSLRTFE